MRFTLPLLDWRNGNWAPLLWGGWLVLAVSGVWSEVAWGQPPVSQFTQTLLKQQQARNTQEESPGKRPAPIPFEWVEDWKPRAELRPWKHIVLHHSGGSRGNVAELHEAHRQRLDENGRPWRGIGYHFVIGNGQGMPDGRIEATFRWDDQLEGAHAGDAEYNQQGIGICLIGNFDEQRPTTAQLRAVEQLVSLLKRDYGIKAERVVGHRDVKPTRCPGQYFPMERVSRVLPPVVLARNGPTARLRDEDAPAPDKTLRR